MRRSRRRRSLSHEDEKTYLSDLVAVTCGELNIDVPGFLTVDVPYSDCLSLPVLWTANPCSAACPEAPSG